MLKPRRVVKPPPLPKSRLSPRHADLVVARLEYLEFHEGGFESISLKEWRKLCLVLCPEKYADEFQGKSPPKPAPLVRPGSAEKIKLLTQRKAAQKCLWSSLEPSLRPEFCELFCSGEEGGGKRKRRSRSRCRATHSPSLTAQQQADSGSPPKHWHQGMLRLEDAIAEVLETHEYNPARNEGRSLDLEAISSAGLRQAATAL